VKQVKQAKNLQKVRIILPNKKAALDFTPGGFFYVLSVKFGLLPLTAHF